MNDTFSIPPGGAVLSHSPNGFGQIYGVWVDNFSGGWLGIEGQDLWVPPYTRGWKAEFMPGMSSISMRSYDFANGATIAGATGKATKVILWDTLQGVSEGIDFFDQQTVPIWIGQSGPTPFAGPLIPPPTVGRYRIYEVGAEYDGTGGGSTPESVRINFFATVGIFQVGNMVISPASPTSRSIITKPGGDIPIGVGLSFNITTFDGGAQGDILVWARYAVI